MSSLPTVERHVSPYITDTKHWSLQIIFQGIKRSNLFQSVRLVTFLFTLKYNLLAERRNIRGEVGGGLLLSYYGITGHVILPSFWCDKCISTTLSFFNATFLFLFLDLTSHERTFVKELFIIQSGEILTICLELNCSRNNSW